MEIRPPDDHESPFSEESSPGGCLWMVLVFIVLLIAMPMLLLGRLTPATGLMGLGILIAIVTLVVSGRSSESGGLMLGGILGAVLASGMVILAIALMRGAVG